MTNEEKRKVLAKEEVTRPQPTPEPSPMTDLIQAKDSLSGELRPWPGFWGISAHDDMIFVHIERRSEAEQYLQDHYSDNYYHVGTIAYYIKYVWTEGYKMYPATKKERK